MSLKTIKKEMSAIHPGEILQEDFLIPLNMSQYRLAKNVDVSPRRINEIVHGTRSVTADTALRLSRLFGTSAQFWMNLQSCYDLAVSKKAMGLKLERTVQPLSL